MAKNTLRFGISDGRGNRASTWKLWTETSGDPPELYFANRSLGGALKTSFHQSGQCHVAYSRDTFEQSVQPVLPDNGRFIQKWFRPSEMAPGITLLYRVVTPWSGATIPIEGAFRDVVWVAAAEKPLATEIYIVLVAPGVLVSTWPGARSMGTALIGSLDLASAGTVWAVYRSVPMPDLTSAASGKASFYAGRSEADLEGGNIRGLIFGTEPDGSRVIFDCGFENGKPRDASNDFDQKAAEQELEELALEGLNTGPPIEVGPGFLEEEHRRLDERLKGSK